MSGIAVAPGIQVIVRDWLNAHYSLSARRQPQ